MYVNMYHNNDDNIVDDAVGYDNSMICVSHNICNIDIPILILYSIV